MSITAKLIQGSCAQQQAVARRQTGQWLNRRDRIGKPFAARAQIQSSTRTIVDEAVALEAHLVVTEDPANPVLLILDLQRTLVVQIAARRRPAKGSRSEEHTS